MAFKKGDKVTLKSGGPVMTAGDKVDKHGDPVMQCVWFDAKGTIKREYFDVELLEPYTAPQPPDWAALGSKLAG